MEKVYTGVDANITYNARRCIHAEICKNRLGQVFDPAKRPWINADGAPVDMIEQAVTQCPSGALHVVRNGQRIDPIPAENRAMLWANGPIQFSGALAIAHADGTIEQDTRATLCRCGQSTTKPFCDNAHKASGFAANDPSDADVLFDQSVAVGGTLTLTPTANGPLIAEGNFTISNMAGETVFAGEGAALCRCGASANKPFCDGSHERINFQTE